MANPSGMSRRSSRGGLKSELRVDDANSVESESRAGGSDDYPSSPHQTEETGTRGPTPALFHAGGGGRSISFGAGSGTDAFPSAPGTNPNPNSTEGVGRRGWTDWDREESQSNLRSAVQRQTNDLVDEDAGSVGRMSTGALSLGLNSQGLSGGYDASGFSSGDEEGSSPESTGVSGSEDGSSSDGGTSSDDDDDSTAPVSAVSPAIGLGAGLERMGSWASHSSGSHASADRRGGMERGPSAKAFSSSAESKFIRPSSETLKRGGGGQRRPSGASSAGSRVDSDDGGPTVRSVGSIGTRTAGKMAGSEDRKFRRPSLIGLEGELKGEGGGLGTTTQAKAVPFAKRRPSLDFNILAFDEPDPTPMEKRRSSTACEDEEAMSEVLFNAAEAAAQRQETLDTISLSRSGRQDHAMMTKSLSRRSHATVPDSERSLQSVDIMIKSDRDKRKSTRMIKKRTQKRKRLRMASKICVALAAAAAITLGTLAALLPPGSGGPVVGAVKQGSREAVVYVQGWMSSDDIDNELIGTKRSATNPSTQGADRTEALMDAAPSVAGGDEGGSGGNRKDLEVRSYSGLSRPHMRGFLTEAVVGDPAADYSAGGNSGGERLRDLEEGLAAPSKLAQYPNILPPLHSFNTAEHPLDEGIHIPPHVTTNLADVWSRPLRPADVPLLWVPAPASATSHDGSDLLRSALSRCLGAVEASELGGETHGMLLTVIDRREGEIAGAGERRYVNVDVTSPKGIKRALRIKLVRSGMIDLLASPHLSDTSAVFGDVAAYDPRDTNVARGRAFALFRHPVHDAAARYSQLLSAAHETGAPFDLTLLEYARSDLVEENPLVRSLTGEFLSAHKKKGAGPVTAQHVEVAKEVVRRKVLVGLSEFMPLSVERFERYFGWGAARREQRTCLNEAAEGVANVLAGETVQGLHPETDEYAELARRNWADVQLYHYTRVLFEEQAALLPPVAEP